MANIFDKILEISPIEAGKKSKSALEWFRQKASGSKISPNTLLTAGDYRQNFVPSPLPGSMFLFQYDAKHKETLPYWDMYPLIFPIQMDATGFLGINLHYLPPTLRASLFSSLVGFGSKNEFEDLKLSYSILTKYSRLSYFKPCLKRYLFSHVKSPFLYIEPDEWPIAIFLPLQRFQGAGSGKVYADSRKIIGTKRKYK
jgi:hypothetical protein